MSMQAQQSTPAQAPATPAPAAPPPPPPPAPAIAGGAQGGGAGAAVTLTEGATPSEILVALRESREELHDQLERLQEQRDEIAQELRYSGENRNAPEGADRLGLEGRLAAVDGRIATLEAQIAATDLQVAQAAAVPGAVVPDPPPEPDPFPEELFVLGGMLIVFGVFPLAVAYARRLWKRSAVAVTHLPRELWDRFAHLEQSVEAVAVEVERIGEGQRFITRVFSENTDARIAAASAHALPVEHDDPLRRR